MSRSYITETKGKTKATRPAHVKVEDLLERAEKARDEWLEAHQDDLEAFIGRSLNHQLESVVAKVLGFDRRWGERDWEIDHCNGRSGNSFIGEAISAKAAGLAAQWLAAALEKELRPTAAQV